MQILVFQFGNAVTNLSGFQSAELVITNGFHESRSELSTLPLLSFILPSTATAEAGSWDFSLVFINTTTNASQVWGQGAFVVTPSAYSTPNRGETLDPLYVLSTAHLNALNSLGSASAFNVQDGSDSSAVLWSGQAIQAGLDGTRPPWWMWSAWLGRALYPSAPDQFLAISPVFFDGSAASGFLVIGEGFGFMVGHHIQAVLNEGEGGPTLDATGPAILAKVTAYTNGVLFVDIIDAPDPAPVGSSWTIGLAPLDAITPPVPGEGGGGDPPPDGDDPNAQPIEGGGDPTTEEPTNDGR